MKPEEFTETVRAWGRAFRDLWMDVMPSRDSKVWSVLLTGSAALMTIAATKPELLPAGWADTIQHWGGVIGMFAAKMGWSWAGSPEPRTVFVPPPQPMPTPMPPTVAVVPKDGGQ